MTVNISQCRLYVWFNIFSVRVALRNIENYPPLIFIHFSLYSNIIVFSLLRIMEYFIASFFTSKKFKSETVIENSDKIVIYKETIDGCSRETFIWPTISQCVNICIGKSSIFQTSLTIVRIINRKVRSSSRVYQCPRGR